MHFWAIFVGCFAVIRWSKLMVTLSHLAYDDFKFDKVNVSAVKFCNFSRLARNLGTFCIKLLQCQTWGIFQKFPFSSFCNDF